MSNSRSDQDRPSDEGSRPIMTGTFDREALVKEFMDYLNSMRESNPNHNHPSLEWVSFGFSHILLDLDQSSIAPLPPDFSIALKNAVADVVSGSIADLRRKLYKHKKHQ